MILVDMACGENFYFENAVNGAAIRKRRGLW